MTMLDFSDRQQLEAFLREQMQTLQEQNKLDFKKDLELVKPGGGRNPKGRVNLVRLINAFVNTEDALFGDYGFLILGFSTDDGQIHHVPMLESGEDKLHPIITHLLEDYLQPVPTFNLHIFDEPEGKKWGVIVMPAGQAVDGPFIFAKESTEEDAKWREGEWRVRRHKKVANPNLDDYRRIERGKIQRELAPFQQRIDDAYQRIAHLEAEVRQLSHRRVPQLSLQIVPQNEPVEILLTPSSEWSALLLRNLRKDKVLIQQIHSLVDALREARRLHLEEKRRKAQDPLASPLSAGLRAELMGFSLTQKNPLVLPETTRNFLKEMLFLLADVEVDADLFVLNDVFAETDLTAITAPALGIHPKQKWSGSQVELHRQVLALRDDLKSRHEERLEYLRREKRQERCFSYDLLIQNHGQVKSGDLQIELSVLPGSEVKLLNHMPATPRAVDAYQRKKNSRGIYDVPLSPFESEPVETYHFVEGLSLTEKSIAPGREASGWRLGAYVAPEHDATTGEPAAFCLRARITSDEIPEPIVLETETQIPVRYYPEKKPSMRRKPTPARSD